MDRCEIFQPKLIGAMGAISQTGFLHHSPPQLVRPRPELQATLIRATGTRDPISGITAPAKTHLLALNEQKGGLVPAAAQRTLRGRETLRENRLLPSTGHGFSSRV
jgi:hypothetical protein